MNCDAKMLWNQEKIQRNSAQPLTSIIKILSTTGKATDPCTSYPVLEKIPIVVAPVQIWLLTLWTNCPPTGTSTPFSRMNKTVFFKQPTAKSLKFLHLDIQLINSTVAKLGYPAKQYMFLTNRLKPFNNLGTKKTLEELASGNLRYSRYSRFFTGPCKTMIYL